MMQTLAQIARPAVGDVRVLVQVVDPLGIEGRRPPLDAMDFVALGQQELRQIGAVLAGDAGDEGFFHASLGVTC